MALARAVSDEALSREILKTVAELLKNSASEHSEEEKMKMVKSSRGDRRKSEYIAFEYDARALVLTSDFDQAGHLQLFNVMREGRGAHAVGLAQPGARRRFFAPRSP
jgi:hypothetical protein